MSRYRFELATPDDDDALRSILAATPMQGSISVSFKREPSWFSGAVVDGRTRQVILCRDTRTGQAVGFGCRSLREVFLNGRPAMVGYLSSLRLVPEHRNMGLVARGYAFLRQLHADGQTPFYLTTVAEGNHKALAVLTSGRAGLPTYHDAGAYKTIAIPPSRAHRTPRRARLNVRPVRPEDLPAVLDFLANRGPHRQFFPRLEVDDFLNPDGMMRGVELERFLLAERNGRLVGTLAGWDQHAYRQSVVHSYSGSLRHARPFYNAWSKLVGRSGLPPPGGAFRYLMGALPVAADEDLEVFAALLDTLKGMAAGGPWSHLLIGLHETDPLLRVAQRHQAACYVTQLFLVCWADGEPARTALDGRIPYLEAGSL